MTVQFEAVLAKVFLRYASPTVPSESSPSASSTSAAAPSSAALPPRQDAPAPESETIPEIFNNALSLAREDMARFSQETNGQRASWLGSDGRGADPPVRRAALTDSTWEEVTEFFDLASEDEGAQRLSFKGFLQLYQLQTGAPLSLRLAVLRVRPC